MNTAEAKKNLRKDMRKLLKELSPEEKQRQSIAACRRLAEREEFLSANTVLVYMALGSECDPSYIAQTSSDMGKRVVYPRCEGEELGLYDVSTGGFVSGAFGILEPDDACTRVDISEVDFAVIPGLAFDTKGGRLGKGKGYYDRLMAEASVFKAGLCFNEQLTECVPMEAHDGRMDIIAAENGIYC